MYKLSSLTRQQLSQLAHSQKAALLGHENYRRFGSHFPLYVKFSHSLNTQTFKPGQGATCYVHRPVIGQLLIAEVITLPSPTPDMLPGVFSLSTAVYDLNDPMTIDYSELDAFVILIGLEGSCEITDNSNHTLPFCEGEVVLIPACTKHVKLEGTIKFLEAYV